MQTKHEAYFRTLATMPKFLERRQLSSLEETRSFIDSEVMGFARLASKISRERVVFQHMYAQDLDSRLYQLNQPGSGWCLGISGYWLRNKRQGINVFPNIVYNDEELSKSTGAPIKLMENQKKMKRLEAGLVDIGGTSLGSKNTLDYIAGGKASNAPPVVNLDMTSGRGRIDAESRRFYSLLAPRGAQPGEYPPDMFLVGMTGKKWGKHMMALDLNGVEFFDPNFGVFAPANKSRQKLVDFLFKSFFPIFYDDIDVTAFKLYRIG
ncbi:MAG: C58 family peptidase [Desulfobacterales bacterium]|nr:C58 family peptidase [Desulfobacterales bacterium]